MSTGGTLLMGSEETKKRLGSWLSKQQNLLRNASNQASKKGTEIWASVQRATCDAQTEGRKQQAAEALKPKGSKGKNERQRLLMNHRASIKLIQAIEDYVLDHEGGNHSPKTVEWHRIALGLLQTYLTQERKITLVAEIDAPDLNAWLAYLRKSPGGHGKVRSEHTIQTYARSVRAFFHWLVRRKTIETNPFDRVQFPKVGKPLIQTIEPDEVERLLVSFTPPNDAGPLADS